MTRQGHVWKAMAVALGLALAPAVPSHADRESVQMELISVHGPLYRVADRKAGGQALEISSDLGGRYRIDPTGLGASLRAHVGEAVTVVGVVRPFKRDGLPLLRVQRFTVYGS